MPGVYFTPWRADRHPCWHCSAFDGIVTGGALCSRPGCCRLRSQPENGCSAFEREVGTDDEVGLPTCQDDAGYVISLD